jgi:PAS domain S-box-containing protein
MENGTPNSGQANAARQHIENRYRAVIESSDDAIIGKDLNGRVASWNPAAERMFSYTEQEILGQPITKLIPKQRLSEEKVILARILQGDQIQHYETTRLRKNADEFPASISISPIRCPQGNIIGAAKIIRDISERKAADLLSKDNRFRALFETIVDGVVLINAKGLIQAFNPAAVKLFGYMPIEVLGKNIGMLMPAPHAEQHDTHINNYLRTGVKKVIGIGREAEGKRKDGSIFPVELTISEMEVDGERIFTGIIRDISQRKQAEAAYDFEQKLASDLLQRLWEAEKADKSGLTIWRGENLPGKRYFSGDLLLHASCYGHTYVLHADSMGHGLVAALPLLPLGDLFYALARSGHMVGAIAANLNRMLFERMPRGRFVSATILRINPNHRSIEIWNGGMPPIVLFTAESANPTQIGGEHPALGVVPPDDFNANTLEWQWDAQYPQRLFSYSDGLTDAQNADGEIFGQGRALELFKNQVKNRDKSADIYKAFIDFVDAEKAQDDISLLIVDCELLRS